MKFLRFICGKPEWSIPLDEVSGDMKRVLYVQWRTFISELCDVDRRRAVGRSDSAIIEMLERSFAAADATAT